MYRHCRVKRGNHNIITIFRFFLISSFILFQSIVRDFAARSSGIIQEAMKWAPNATRSHLVDYLSNHENSVSGLSQHVGLSLAAEALIQHSGLNSTASPLSATVLDRWPNCVKKSYSEFIATMSLRSHYMGEIAGMTTARDNTDDVINSLLTNFKLSCDNRDVEAHTDCAYKLTAMLISTRKYDRQLIHALAWAPINFFSHKTIDCIISCWKWGLSARSDLELQVNIFKLSLI